MSSRSSKPAHKSTKLDFRTNLLNACLMVGAGLPSVLMYWWFLSRASHLSTLKASCDWSVIGITNNPSHFFDCVTDQGVKHPIILLNVLLFLNMDVLLWLLSFVSFNKSNKEQSTWLIDPYWTIIPVMIAHYYSHHPSVHPNVNETRSTLAFAVLYIWSIRLTHSYFRREEWQFGMREDWRFTMMKHKFEPIVGKSVWQGLTFFIAYVSQHPFLFGLTLPMFAVQTSNAPLSIFDWLAVAVGLSGIALAYFADTQLRTFMAANEKRAAKGEPKILLLETGVWKYSRHPNYAGEILWWTGFSLFSISTGHPEFMLGSVVNALLLLVVSQMVESRMLENETRREVYRGYQKRVSLLIPWFRTETNTKAVKAT